MNILVSNDDGIQAAGLRLLVDTLASIDGVNVYVCAPDGERSAASHSISTTRGPVMVVEEEVPGAVWARALSGTPADCVKFAIKKLRQEGIEFDVVFSGINHGSNIGSDVLYSGTASAAAEALLCRVPGIAMSLDRRRPKPEQLENMRPMILDLVKKAVPAIDSHTLLNVNYPGCRPEEIRGMKITRMGPREYNETFEIQESPRKQKYFWYSGTVVHYEGLPEDLDIMAHQDNYITVTPLKLDLTDLDMLDTVTGWDLLGK